MKRTMSFALIPLAVLAFLLHGALASVHAQHAPDARAVTVTLHSEATVDDTIVTLDQIAKLTGGSEAQRKRLGKLDVLDFPVTASSRVATSDLVRFRLLLSGMEATDFRLSGAKRTTIVEPDEPITFRRLLGVAEHAVRTGYPGNPGAAMTAGKGIVVPLIDTHPTDRVRFEAVVKGTVPLSGRVGVDVSLLVNGKKREVVPFYLDIVPPAVAAKSSGTREQPVRTAANWTPGPVNSTPATIKAKDNVKLVVAIGDARIEATGEALEDGRIGQVIRVRNADSNRIVHGRVEASGIVAVEP
jgi:flagellar basal body P-ring formation protein FlgA